jgi:5,10-methylenetetrahydromethanopterin reductase
VILAPAVLRVRVAEDGGRNRDTIGQVDLALQREPILSTESDPFHLAPVLRSPWDDGSAMTITGREVGEGRRGIVLRDPLPWDECVQVARAAEETGYEVLFLPEIDGREAFASLAGYAHATSRMRLGTGVVAIGARTAATTAMAAATVQDLSGGRFVLGIGSGPSRSLEAVREYLSLVRETLSGLSLRPRGGPPPIWLAALGNGMVGLAAESADGVLLNWCTPTRVAQASALIAKRAESAGRDPGSITIAVYVRACLGVEEAIALSTLREMTGRYAAIPHYLRQLELMGLGREAGIAAKAFATGRLDDVPEALVRALAVLGGRKEALTRFDEFVQAGADLVLCYPVAALEPYSSVLGTVLTAAPTPAMER